MEALLTNSLLYKGQKTSIGIFRENSKKKSAIQIFARAKRLKGKHYRTIGWPKKGQRNKYRNLQKYLQKTKRQLEFHQCQETGTERYPAFRWSTNYRKTIIGICRVNFTKGSACQISDRAKRLKEKHYRTFRCSTKDRKQLQNLQRKLQK